MTTKSTEKKVEEAVKAVAKEFENSKGDCCNQSNKYGNGTNASAGAVYGLGLIGALVYFIQQADSFGQGLVGVLKAIVWPAFLVYEAFSKLL